MNNVVHFEIPADDPTRAKSFYKKIFGWGFNDMPAMDYTIVLTSDVDKKTGMPTKPGSINGGMTKRGGPVSQPVITIAVKNIDETGREIEMNGGKMITPKRSIESMGFTAYFKDSEGNTIGLWQSA